MRELSVAEQRYQAVMAVISDGLSVSQVAEKVGVSRQTLHTWLARYEAQGLEGLVDRSHRPVSCPHQVSASDAGSGGGGGGGVAPLAPVLGSSAVGVRAGKTTRHSGAVGVGGLWGVAAGGHGRSRRSGSAFTEVETLGTRRAYGVVADGHCGRFPVG